MRKILFISFIFISTVGFYYWDVANKTELTLKEAELIENMKSEKLKESLHQIIVVQQGPEYINKDSNPGNENSIAIKEFKVEKHNWELLKGLPGTDKSKVSTIELLDLLKSMDEQGEYVNLSNTKEVANAIIEFNKDPAEAEAIFEYIINQPELQNDDLLLANILKISTYTNFNKETLVDIAEQTIQSSNINSDGIKASDMESKGQILKISEASKIIMANKFNQKDELINYVQKNLRENIHPLIKHEILNQLRSDYPNDAYAIEAQLQQDGMHDISSYLMKEVSQ